MKLRFTQRKRPIWISTLVIGVLFLSGNCKEMQTIAADIYVAVDGKDIKQ